jgi:peptidoglycan/LPS O-acetylase OafA/YrhL
MTSPAVVTALSVVLAVYGLYAASYIPGLLIGIATPILLLGRVVEALLAFAAAFAVWTRRGSAPVLVIGVALAIAAMWLTEGFVLGIVAYLYALGAAILVAILGLACASYLRRVQRSDARSSPSRLAHRRSA